MQEESLTPNFKLSEFLRSEIALRRGIINEPDAEQLQNIRHQLAPGMQRIRNTLQQSIHISSGFRCFVLNSAIGSKPTSQHIEGLACDFTAPAFGTPLEICRFLEPLMEELGIDQLIFEGEWVHISFTVAPRHSVLTAHFEGSKTTYTQGLA